MSISRAERPKADESTPLSPPLGSELSESIEHLGFFEKNRLLGQTKPSTLNGLVANRIWEDREAAPEEDDVDGSATWHGTPLAIAAAIGGA